MFLRSFLIQTRNYASPNRIKPFQMPKVWPEPVKKVLNLRERGFLRANKAYDPPKNAGETVRKIAEELGGDANFQEKKFELLKNCFATFQHSVPNSQLYEIKSLDDVIAFYSRKVCNRTPYENLVSANVPNLHLVAEYKRYDPKEDGVSAFPKSSTLVTGLKNRKKYKGHIAKTSWP